MPAFKPTIKGPLFTNSKKYTDQFLIEAKAEVALESKRRILARLRQVLQHPTGLYESKITISKRRGEPFVSDLGIIYGGWLEGVSRRNQTTRFKGYFTFRRIKQEIIIDTPKIVARQFQKYIDRMNGS
jgi:hypothetical protein